MAGAPRECSRPTPLPYPLDYSHRGSSPVPTTLTRWLRLAPARRRTTALSGVEQLEARDVPNSTPFALSQNPVGPTGGLLQDWTNTGLITASGSWAGVPSIEGYSGKGLAAPTAGDPRTVVLPGILGTDTPAGVISVTANQTNPNTFTGPGVAEFDGGALIGGNPTIALRAQATNADSPFLLFYVDATNVPAGGSIWVSFLLRDIQSVTPGIVPISVQSRVAVTGAEAFAPAAAGTNFFVADGTIDQDVYVSAQIPKPAADADKLQIRIITTVPAGTTPPAEWVGIDYINVSASRPPTLALGTPPTSYLEGTTMQFAQTGGTVTDADSPNLAQGYIRARVSAGYNSGQDVLSVNNQGTGANQIGFTPATGAVTFSNTPIGTATFDTVTGTLLMTFNANATPAAAQAFLRNITYRNTSTAPDTAVRTVTLVMEDGDGAISLPASLSFGISLVNNPPQTNPDPAAAGPVDYLLNSGPVVVAPDATVADPDFPVSRDLTGGILTVSYQSGAHPDNRLTVRSSPTPGPNTIRVTPSGNIEYTPTAGQAQIVARIGLPGLGTQALTVEFINSDLNPATNLSYNAPAVVELILRNVTFETVGTSFDLTDRVLRFNLTDGDGINQFLASNVPTVLYADSDTFRTINPLASNTLPSFTIPTPLATATEDAAPVSVPGFAATISPGQAAYEAGQALTFNVTAADTTLFSAQPAIDPVTGQLTFTPAANAFGTTTVTVSLSDDGTGTVEPGKTSADQTFTITLNPVADTPTTNPANPSTNEDTPTAPISVVPFFADGSSVTHYKVTSIHGGTLRQTSASGPVVNNGDFIPVGVALVFSPDADEFGPAGNFGYSVQASLSASDAGLGGAVVPVGIAVAAVNDAPVVTGINGTTPYLVTAPAIVVAPGAVVTDIDSTDFVTGTLTVDVTTGAGPNDALGVRDQGTGPGQVGVTGATVTYGGTTVGTITTGPGGATLVVTFNANATVAAVAAVAANVTFSAPDTPGARTVRFVLTDGDGGTSTAATTTVNVTDTVSVLSIVRGAATPTNSSILTWTVTTDLPLSSLTPANFALTGTLAGVSTVQSVTPGPATVFTVTVDVGGSDGTIGLDLTTSPVTAPFISNVPFTGPLYDVDRTGPFVVSFDDDDVDNLVSLNQTVTYTITFSEDVDAASVGAADFDNAGTAGISIGAITETSPGVFTVPVTATSGGTLILRVPATGVIADVLGNDNPTVFTDNDTLTVDGTPPDVDTITNDKPTSLVTPGTAITYTVTFSEDVAVGTVTAADFGNADAPSSGAPVTIGAVTQVNSTTFTVVVTPTASGSLRLRVGPAITDVAGNPMTAAVTDATVVTVNAAPVAVADAYPRLGAPLINEDGGTYTVAVADGVLANDTDANDATATLRVSTTPVVAPTKGTLVLAEDGSFTYTPFADAFGTDSFTYTVTDPLGFSSTATVTLTISPVNDAPTFTLDPTVTVLEDSGPFPATVVVTNAAAGGTGAFAETEALVGFTVTVESADPTMGFSQLPQVQLVGNTGRLTFTPAPNAYGTATVRVTLTDSGVNGGPNVNASSQTFQIVVTPVNDAPSFALPGNPPTSDEDAGPQAVPGFAQFNPGANEGTAGQTAAYDVTVLNTTGKLTFTTPPAIAPDGTLTYAAAPDAFGTATVQVRVRDSGGTANGGADTSAGTQSFVIVVRAQNDSPVANPDTAVVPKDAGPTVIAVLANDTPDPDGSEILTVVAVGRPANGTAALAPGGAGILYTPAPGFTGTDTFSYTIADGTGSPATGTVTVTVRAVPAGQPLFDVVAVGSGPGGGPIVRVNSLTTGDFTSTFAAYDPNFRGGVNVGIGDVNGDGVPDVVVTPGFGGGPHVKVIDGTMLGLVGPDGAIAPAAVLASFFAYDPAFRGGVTVTVSDVDGDGKADVVTGTGPGGGAHVKVFSGATLSQGRPTELASFFAFDPSFRGGVNVAAGDVDGDGRADIVTAAASGGGSHVKVFNGLGGQPLLRSFFAYGATFGGGVSVAAGDVNGDGLADIITGAGVGGGPHVKVFDSRGAELASFFALTGGAAGADVAYRVANDGTPLVVVGGQTNGSQVRTFAAPDFRLYSEFDAYESSFLGGVEVG